MKHFLAALTLLAAFSQVHASVPPEVRARSVYLRADLLYPLGSERSFRLLREFKAIGVKHVTVELRYAVESVNANRVEVARFTGYNAHLYRAFLSGLKNYEIMITLKPVFVLRDGVTIVEPEPTDPVQFMASYESAITQVAKLARTAGVEEMVVGTGLGKVLCSRPSLVAGVANRIASVLPNSPSDITYRLDYASASEHALVESCSTTGPLAAKVSNVLSPFAVRGMDLPSNPTLESATYGLENGLILARVAFDGPGDKQAAKAQALHLGLITRGYSGEKLPASWGIFSTSPYSVGTVDETESPRGKPMSELLKKWFQ